DHPGADLVALCAQHLLREGTEREAERETTAGGRTGDQKLAARDLRGCARLRRHGASPLSLVAGDGGGTSIAGVAIAALQTMATGRDRHPICAEGAAIGRAQPAVLAS